MIDHNTPGTEDPGPTTQEECNATIDKIGRSRYAFIARRGHSPNTVVLSNRQFYGLVRFGRGSMAVHPTSDGHNEFHGMKIIVDARGDYPNTPLVGHIEF